MLERIELDLSRFLFEFPGKKVEDDNLLCVLQSRAHYLYISHSCEVDT